MICPIIWHEHPVGIEAGQELINHGTWQCENISGEWRMFCLGKQSILVQKWQVKSDQTLGANESIWVATSHGWFYSNWPFDMTNTHTPWILPFKQTNWTRQLPPVDCSIFPGSFNTKVRLLPYSLVLIRPSHGIVRAANGRRHGMFQIWRSCWSGWIRIYNVMLQLIFTYM